jgi:uncharacterized protein (DUF1800 family)/tellurite resistance protein
MPNVYCFAAIGLCCIPLPVVAELDSNNNSQSDVWEMVFQAMALPPAGDQDADGWSNELESTAGTNPFDGASHPENRIGFVSDIPVITWKSEAGKQYTLLKSDDLTTFEPDGDAVVGSGAESSLQLPPADGRAFFRIRIRDMDSDGDGVNDWEELAVGFNPSSNRTDRYAQTDLQRVTAGLTAASIINVSVYDDTCSERWPDPAVLVLRRSGGLKPLTVGFSLGGSAARDVDYQASIVGNTISFTAGQREAFVEIHALGDDDHAESAETVVLTASAGAGYTVGAASSSLVTVLNETSSSGPSAKAAARFLIQAAFGPDQDESADADQIPENVEQVMAIGFEGWIDDQLTRPVGSLLPMVQWQNAQPGSAEIYNDRKQNAWWGRAMGLPKLRPDATEEQLPDPLRQRVAFALSQIFVISDRMERLAVEPEGMIHFYDTLLNRSFGNFRDLLEEVSLHPCMGIYLSHMGNRKADSIAKTFPDENFAREVMQLFSIGLWRLDPDGEIHLSDGTETGPDGLTVPLGQPIPTYDNSTITSLARVFTGLSFGKTSAGGNNNNFELYDGDFNSLMKGWDEHHDLTPKTLVSGAVTPARVANGGQATMADVDAVMDDLFNHPNVGPFIGKQLIQRLVTSNPSAAYIARVTAAFNAAPRGDLGRTVKAILLDPEARDPVMMADPEFGKLREPFIKAVNVARAFNATSSNGWYYLDAFILDHAQEPLKAPSVFNFYLPHYSPPGPLAEAGLVAPEFQIVNASSGTTAPNYFWDHITGGLHRWGAAPDKNVTLNLTQEMLLNVPAAAVNDPSPSLAALDPDPLIRRLDLVLTGGTLEPESFRIIREALNRIGPGSGWEWPRDRLKLAIYLIVSSPEFAVQH